MAETIRQDGYVVIEDRGGGEQHYYFHSNQDEAEAAARKMVPTDDMAMSTPTVYLIPATCFRRKKDW